MTGQNTNPRRTRLSFEDGLMQGRVDELAGRVDRLVAKIDELIPAVAELKVKAGLWGGAGGLFAALLAIGIALAIRG